MDDTPALVTLHVWGVPARSVAQFPAALVAARRRLAGGHGATFARVLGTATGGRMTLAGADPRHWAVLACWPSSQHALEFERSGTAARLDRHAYERLTVRMRVVASRGRWAGRQPFGRQPFERGAIHGAPVDGEALLAVLTRARVRPRRLPAFARAARHVASDLAEREGRCGGTSDPPCPRSCDGPCLAFGVGEAPAVLQGTFSIWPSAQAMQRFAYGTLAHREAVRRTAAQGWYAEDLFARFTVTDLAGRYRGHPWGGRA